jgi:hypothetical protein
MHRNLGWKLLLLGNFKTSNKRFFLLWNSLSQYWDFLVQCPEFTCIVKLQNSKTTRSGFDFGIVPTFHLPIFSPLSSSGISSPKSSDEEDKSYVFTVDVSPLDL